MLKYKRVAYLNDFVYEFYDWLIANDAYTMTYKTKAIETIRKAIADLKRKEPDKVFTIEDINQQFIGTQNSYISELIDDFELYITSVKETTWQLSMMFTHDVVKRDIKAKTFAEAYQTALDTLQKEFTWHSNSCAGGTFYNSSLGISGRLPFKPARQWDKVNKKWTIYTFPDLT